MATASAHNTMKPRILYPVMEAAYLLGMSKSEIYVRMTSGQIKSCKVGRLRRIPAAEIEAFANRMQAEAS
jgi:excisionase family DNA binding protein